MTLVLVPLALLMNFISYRQQSLLLTHRVGIKTARNIPFFLFYALFYSLILQPACVFGYIKEMVAGKVKNWGTK